MKLDQYISELLFEHECVIIPGFGGIVSNYRPSFLNPAHHTFSPPSKRLAFNASLRTNDGLLASHLSKRLAVNYTEANSYINSFVSDCLKSLHSGDKLVLDQVGVLYLDDEKNLQFMPDASVNYLKSSFGLYTLHSPAIHREETLNVVSSAVKKKTKKKKIANWRFIEVIPVAAILALLMVNPSVVTKLNEQVASLNPFPKPIVLEREKAPVKKEEAPAIVLSSDSAYTSTQVETPADVTTQEVKAEEQPVAKEEAPAINLRSSVEAVEAESKVAATEIIEEAKIDKTLVKKETHAGLSAKMYYVIGGCFRIEENATKFLNQSIADGFQATIIGKNDNGLTMVSLFSTNDAQKATTELEAIRAKASGGAWLLHQ